MSDGAAAGQLDRGTELPKAEQRKLDSDYLKEPLLTELGNDLPNFSEDALQILKFHGSYQQDDRDKREKGRDKTWQMMLRLRSPGGRIPHRCSWHSMICPIDSATERSAPPPVRPSRCTASRRLTCAR